MNKIIRVIVSSLFLFIITPSAFADIERVSVSSTGEQGDLFSRRPSISANGRFAAFTSSARNLVEGDTNQESDVFVYDRQTGIPERVSVSSFGLNSVFSVSSDQPSISANGRFVAFRSYAPDLVVDDTNARQDIFVYDRDTGMIERVSVSSTGEQGTNQSNFPSISADGRYVAFQSFANNLVDGDNGNGDVFVHDRSTGITERVSLSSTGEPANNQSDRLTISADGQFVAFTSRATNLVAGDTNQKIDIFVHDRSTGVTERVSVSSAGVQGNASSSSPSISADGRFVAFSSSASTLVAGGIEFRSDIFVHDRETGITELLSEIQDTSSTTPSISANGRFVAFVSSANNLVVGDTNDVRDVFVHDRQTGMTERVSVSSTGEQGDLFSRGPSISADGLFVAFESDASNLVDGDTNRFQDVFVTDNPLVDSNSDLITIEVLINSKARETRGDAAQLLTGTLFEVSYKVTNNSPDRLTGVQIFEDGDLVCDVYSLNPGQTKQRSRCKASRTVFSGHNQFQSIVTGKVTGSPTMLTNDTDAYYTGIDNASGELDVTHRINNINADSESQAPTLDSSMASVSFKIENTGDIELYRVKTYHDPASPVNSGWDLQCFIGTLKPGQIRYCKRDIILSESGLNKAWGRVQGKSASVSPTGAINAANPTYFIVP